MIYHTARELQIVFGGSQEAFEPQRYKHLESGKRLLDEKPFDYLKNLMHIEHLIFLHQVHGNQGLIISTFEQAVAMKPFSSDGDFLISNLSGIGLAVATADCLPIILYSPHHHIVGIVHAGWRGSANRVVVKALECLKNMGGLDEKNIQVFFGPSAKKCCYSVGSEVLDSLHDFSYKDQVVHQYAGQTFFDVPLFNQLQLQEAGLPKESFTMDYNYCTICDLSFCSYRRQHDTMRQMTVVAM